MSSTLLQEQLMSDLRKFRTLRPTTRKVMISVTDKDHVDHHVVVPIPKSYEAAKTIAFDTLGRHLPISPFSKRDALLERSFLNFALLSSAGDLVWSSLSSDFWSDVIGDGDQLRFLIEPEAPLDWTRNGGRLARFMLLGSDESVDESGSVVIPLPRSYQDARRFALTTFYQRYPTRGIILRVKKRVGGSPQWVHVESRQEKDWLGFFDDIFETESFADIGVDGHRLH